MSWLTHLVGGVVRTLLDYVGYVSVCPRLRRILKTRPEWEEISDILSKNVASHSNAIKERQSCRHEETVCLLPGKPRSLQHLCRLVIRENMSLKVLNDPGAMAAVPFPPMLKNYVTFRGSTPHADLAT